MDKKIKVVWVCHFSCEEVHCRLPLGYSWLYTSIYRLIKGRKPTTEVEDFAIWNVNAIEEMKKYADKIELHIISPYKHLAKDVFEFTDFDISYHFFKNRDKVIEVLHHRFPNLIKPSYRNNRKTISKLIGKIRPNIVHYIGAENPYYSIAALDCPVDVPLIVQLQTLMNNPEFEKHYPIDHASYVYRAGVERMVIERADFIGTILERNKRIITTDIKSNANFLDISLALAEKPDVRENCEKKQDFVYFAKDINKAADWAIEGFAIAHSKMPELKLKIVGNYTEEYKAILDKRINELGIYDSVVFTGKLPTHSDVIEEVRHSRFALLPLKIDFISGTIREAMSIGIPVVTTITAGTPSLNEKRESVLLSKPEDFVGMADNILRLKNDDSLAKKLSNNGVETIMERYNNIETIRAWVDCYKSLNSCKI